MRKILANAVESLAKPAKVEARQRAHLAKVVVARPSYKKMARQASFNKAVRHLSVAKAVCRAKLISEVNPAEFRIIRMPG